MSKQADSVYDILKELFPHNIIVKEHYLYYKGQRLFFDYFIKDLGVLIECQGKQHEEFIRHFHKDKQGYFNHRDRDNLKLEYVESHERYCLARIFYNEKIDKRFILKKINSALASKRGFV
jgi:hypothetical protein